MTLDPDHLAALDAAATPGPWEVDTLNSEGSYGSGDDTHEGFATTAIYSDDGKALFDALNSDAILVQEEWDEDGGRAYDLTSAANATLVAYLRNAVPDILALIEERDRLRLEVAGADQRAAFAESRLHAFRQSRAARAKTLSEFIKARAPELWPDYAAVSVNGALYDEEGFHPNYEREMNILRHRAEKAEEGLAEARAALAGEKP